MPPRKTTPAPIDRPLSRAYLREFKGWATAYPPGVSDPTSLRIMENAMITREGACRVRPGLRYLNYVTLPDTDTATVGTAAWPDNSVVGSHETFFLEDGTKAYLYAARETDGTVGFRVFADTSDGTFVHSLESAGFTVPDLGAASLAFTEATTYVKYLQIDNKIFALSNAGEPMRLFYVGAQKIAKKLQSIDVPGWDADDKLDVVHPEAAWINSGEPLGTRINRFKNPTFADNTDFWNAVGSFTQIFRSNNFARTGDWSLRARSLPTRRNIVKQPLHNVTTAADYDTWTPGNDILDLSVDSGAMRARIVSNVEKAIVISELLDVTAGEVYRAGFDLASVQLISKVGVMIRYYDEAGVKIGGDDYINQNLSNSIGRKQSGPIVLPLGCKKVRLCLVGYRSQDAGICRYGVKNIYLGLDSEDDTTALDGQDGANYFWEGTVGASESVYHPPKDVKIRSSISAGPDDWTASIYVRPTSGSLSARCNLQAETTSGAFPAEDEGSPTSVPAGAWTRVSNTVTAPANTGSLVVDFVVGSVERGTDIYFDDGLLERASAVDDYFSGATEDTTTLKYSWEGDPHASISYEKEYAATAEIPDAETPTADTLICDDRTQNTHSFAFFYTFSNEIGESAVSQVTTVRTQRAWTEWVWETPNVSGEPSGNLTKVPELSCDQLVAYMPSTVFDDAIGAGALKWSLYMFTWSDEDPMPVVAQLVATRDLTVNSTHEEHGWLRVTPSAAEVASDIAPIPSRRTRFNASDPGEPGQGLVAADRLVLVLDPTAQAVIRWSSNQQGSYSDFSPSKGGGYKTLTSGNLFVPACVKLWQNPQSVDTLTILCLGVDGHSTGYYMAPAQIASQSEAVNIMAFEETTATPGTTSPYGCEVLNNALYHPLDEHLMKSTAANYNINHSTITDMIQDQWRNLRSKQRIVSSHLDNRLYYLVYNPEGAALEDDCWGNEVWVYDAAQKTGTWSRWLTQGSSLRKIEQGGKVVMSLVHPTGIFYFDEEASTDDYVDTNGDVLTRNIDWQIETNTQGANRAHDAWVNLQQVNIDVGNFIGAMEYGIRGIDRHGMPVEISKVMRDTNDPGDESFDLEDFLLIRKEIQEWFFFARSAVTAGVTEHSEGQLSTIQYRYTPISVNVGYEQGSVETFEYSTPSDNTVNGVPIPMIDTARP